MPKNFFIDSLKQLLQLLYRHYLFVQIINRYLFRAVTTIGQSLNDLRIMIIGKNRCEIE